MCYLFCGLHPLITALCEESDKALHKINLDIHKELGLTMLTVKGNIT